MYKEDLVLDNLQYAIKPNQTLTHSTKLAIYFFDNHLYLSSIIATLFGPLIDQWPWVVFKPAEPVNEKGKNGRDQVLNS